MCNLDRAARRAECWVDDKRGPRRTRSLRARMCSPTRDHESVKMISTAPHTNFDRKLRLALFNYEGDQIKVGKYVYTDERNGEILFPFRIHINDQGTRDIYSIRCASPSAELTAERRRPFLPQGGQPLCVVGACIRLSLRIRLAC